MKQIVLPTKVEPHQIDILLLCLNNEINKRALREILD